MVSQFSQSIIEREEENVTIYGTDEQLGGLGLKDVRKWVNKK